MSEENEVDAIQRLATYRAHGKPWKFGDRMIGNSDASIFSVFFSRFFLAPLLGEKVGAWTPHPDTPADEAITLYTSYPDDPSDITPIQRKACQAFTELMYAFGKDLITSAERSITRESYDEEEITYTITMRKLKHHIPTKE